MYILYRGFSHIWNANLERNICDRRRITAPQMCGLLCVPAEQGKVCQRPGKTVSNAS